MAGPQVEGSGSSDAGRWARSPATGDGVVPGQEDPYLKTIQSLVDHAQELEQTVSALSEKVRRMELALAEAPKADPLRAIK